MKLLRSTKKIIKLINFIKLLLIMLVIGIIYFFIKYLTRIYEGFEGHTTLLLNHMKGCGHCEKLMPEWEKLERENNTNIKIKKVEVNDNPIIAKKYGVEGFPTIILIGPNGEKLDTYKGRRDSSALLSYLKSKA